MTREIIIDIHNHSEYSVDGSYTVMKMCQTAREKGVRIYAITDHYDISGDRIDFSDMDKALSKSVSDTVAAAERFEKDMQVLVGIELGQPSENEAKADEVLSAHPFDFVIGAIHNAPGRPDLYFYARDKESIDLDYELELYFSAYLDKVKWGKFDSAAHLGYPFRYIVPACPAYDVSKWDDHMEAVLKALVEKGLGIEINTSGIAKNPPYTTPGAKWIKRFKELGGEKLTLGSDAHSPGQIAIGLREGMEIAADAGFSYLCYFIDRKAQYLSLKK